MFGSCAWNPYGRMFFTPDGDGAGGAGGQGGDGGGGGKPPADPLDGLTPEARAAVQKQVDAAAAAARKEAEKSALAKFEADQQAKQQAEKEERERQEAIKRGEFDQVKTDLEQRIAAASGERDQLTTRLTAYETALTPMIDSLKGELPAEALKGYPEEADAVARLAWLQERKELVATLRPAGDGTPAPRVPATPRPNGATPPADPAKDERARRQAMRSYSG